MVLKIWILLLSFFSAAQFPANTESVSLKMSISEWRFITGDNAQFGNADFDDSGWKKMTVPGYWEQNGYPGYDGIGWYRSTFIVPETWRSKSGFSLNVGWVDDDEETYFNGQLIGASSGYNKDRIYRVPRELVRFGGKNVVSVKVIDNGMDGGMYSTAPQLSTINAEPEFDVDKY